MVILFLVLFFCARDAPRDVGDKTKSPQAVLSNLRGGFLILRPRKQRTVVLQSIRLEVLEQLQGAPLVFLDGAV